MADGMISTLGEQLGPIVAKEGLFLQEVRVSRAGKYSTVTVVVDLPSGPGGVAESQLVAASRAVSHRLDELDPFSQPYTLEVTTPGAERKLSDLREWGRAVGRTVEAEITDAGIIQFELQSVSEDGITGVVEGQERSFSFVQIESARTVVAFGK